MLLLRAFFTKVRQPFWAFLSFKTSPIVYSRAEMSWFIPLPCTQPSASDPTRAAWAAGWWGCLPCGAAPRTPSSFEGRSLAGSALLISTQLCSISSIPAPRASQHRPVLGRCCGAALQTGDTSHGPGGSVGRKLIVGTSPQHDRVGRSVVCRCTVRRQALIFFLASSKLLRAETNLSLFACT